MANVTTHNPWILDTAATITAKRVVIVYMEYVPSAATNAAVVKDGDGNIIWNGVAQVDAKQVKFTPSVPIAITGFELDSITAGTLYVWLG